MDATARLALWLALVAFLIVLVYASRAESGKPSPQILYEWSTAVGAIVQDGVLLLLVLAIAGFDRQLLAWRRPVSWPAALKLLGVALAAIYAFEVVFSAIVHPGNEQGLTPSRWEPNHAAAYVVNGLVICLWVPFVEETTYRGLGYSLLARFGQWTSIVTVGVLFGLSHGLLVTLPVIAAFGCVLAYVRAKTDSVYPGMLLHATFNLIALIVAVA
jgi:hypothetical protein